MPPGWIRPLTSLALCALLGACQSWSTQPTSVVEEPARAEPALPAGYVKTPPAPAQTSRAILSQTAAVFIGRVVSVKHTFDDCAGPRTNYVISEARSLFGTEVPSQVTLSVFGGPTPRGTWMSSDDLPHLALDGRYTVFLRNTDWTFSPILRNLAFRSETVAGREVLVDSEGRLVTGWGASGPVLSEAIVSEAVGRHARGYRDVQAGVRNDVAVSGVPAGAAPELRRGPARAGGAAAELPDLGTDRSLTRDELVRSRLFERPALTLGLPAETGRDALSPEALVSAVRAESDRIGVRVGGRVALHPYWRCWSSTPTTNASRR